MSDGEKPGAEAAHLPVAIDRLQGTDEDLVGGVLRSLRAAESDEAITVDGVKVTIVERGERVPIGADMGDENGIRLAVSNGPFRLVEATKGCGPGLAFATTCVGVCSVKVNQDARKR
jgi:hypothetical protein